MLDKKYTAFSGRLVIIGFGSIGQGVLPLLLRHIEMRPGQITVITAEPRGHEEAVEYGIEFIEAGLTRENYRAVLEPRLGRGDFLLNVSVDVSSVTLIELCRERGALYLDTCIEPCPGGYTDPNLPPAARSNYALRASALPSRRHAGPQLDTARRPLSPVSDHPWRVDLDRRLPDPAGRRARGLPADLPLCLSPLRRRRVEPA